MIKWFRLVYTGSTGHLVSKVLEELSFKFSECLIIIDSFEGSDISSLATWNDCMNLSQLIEMCRNVEHFDWGDMFLLNRESNQQKLDLTEALPVVISKCELALRIIDSTELEVFTKDLDLVNRLTLLSEYQTCQEGQLNDFVYPE